MSPNSYTSNSKSNTTQQDDHLNDIKCRKYLAIILTVPIILYAILLATISIFENKIPAPRFSISESFNEKARWIRNYSANECDVIIVGSSMALNNIDGASIKRITHGKSVLNTGSWGLTVSESGMLLKYLSTLCKPKIIILSVYYGDFDQQWEKTIKWQIFDDYIHGEHTLVTYIKTMDIKYYLSTYIHRNILAKKGNKIYQSLIFDETGPIMFDCNNFEVDSVRWDGQNKYKPLKKDNVDINLSGLAYIEKIAKENNSQLLVIATPLRKIAEEKLSTPQIEFLWKSVSESVNKAGGTFISVRSFYDFKDEQFTDFAHLNRCGASKAMEVITPALTKILQNVK